MTIGVVLHSANVSSSSLKLDLGRHANNCVHVKWMAHYVKVHYVKLF